MYTKIPDSMAATAAMTAFVLLTDAGCTPAEAAATGSPCIMNISPATRKCSILLFIFNSYLLFPNPYKPNLLYAI